MDKQLFAHTFLEEYEGYIKPALSEIDVFLKTSEYPLCPADVACILGIEEDEVQSVLLKIGRTSIDKYTFFDIMSKGSSAICRLYSREVETGSPPTYTPNQVAYIYNLDISAVKNACQKLKIKEITAFTMSLVFAKIPF